MRSLGRKNFTTKIDVKDKGKTLIAIMPDITVTIEGINPQVAAFEIRKADKSEKDMGFESFVKMIEPMATIEIIPTVNLTEEVNERIYSFFMNFIRTLQDKGYKSIKANMSRMSVEIKNGKEIILIRNDNAANFMIRFKRGVEELLPREIDIVPFTELLGCVISIYTGLLHYKLYEDLQKSLKKSFEGYENYIK